MRVFIFTVGCRANQYESDAIGYLLEKKGHILVPRMEEAEICIVNTCTVTHRADYDSRRILRKIIKNNPSAICVVTGCYVQVAYKRLAEIEGIDYLIGNKEKPLIPKLISTFTKQKRPYILVSPNPTAVDTLICFPPPASSKHTRAYLKIQDGCDSFCSYCIVPYARGRSRSLSPDEVIKRIIFLQNQGIKEVVLTGIHLGEYGKDLSPSLSLVELLKHLDKSNLSLRIRLSSLNPSEIDEEMIALIARSQHLCPHLHISLQTGSDEILKRMRRSYSISQFKKLIEIIRSYFPLVDVPTPMSKPVFALGVDIIVGFPGETEKDFHQTYTLIKNLPISYSHIFSYSDRPGTMASKMPNKVPQEVIKVRVKKLRALDREKRLAFFQANLGRIVHVLTEQKKGPYLVGHSENYLPVWIRSYKDLDLNQIMPVKLVQLKDKEVLGEIVN